MGKATVVSLNNEERKTLLYWLRTGTDEVRLAERAKIIIAGADGQSTKAVADRMETRPARVSKWRNRFAQKGIAGLLDAPGRWRLMSIRREH